MNRVDVLDKDGNAVGQLRPAEARQLAKAGVAFFEHGKLRLDPYAQIPRVESTATRESVMSEIHNTLNTMRGGVNAAAMFSGEARPIWLQNQTTIQWSLSIDTPNGEPIDFRLYNTSDPVCITDEIPWEILKTSVEIRKIIGAIKDRKSVVRVMSQEEAVEYFKAKAHRENHESVDAAYNASLEYRKVARMRPSDLERHQQSDGPLPLGVSKTRQEITDALAGRSSSDAGAAQPGEIFVTSRADGPPAAVGGVVARVAGVRSQQEIASILAGQSVAAPFATPAQPDPMAAVNVNSRVMNLCEQSSDSMPQHLRVPGDQFVREIVLMSDQLTMDDLRYIQSHAGYASVVSWAKRKLAEREASRVKEDTYASLIESLEADMKSATAALPTE